VHGLSPTESPLLDAVHCYAVKPDNYCGGTSTRLVNAVTGCTEDRFEHHLGGRLDYPVLDTWNSERPLTASRLLDPYSIDRLRLVRLRA
jgi:hypothetical protein